PLKVGVVSPVMLSLVDEPVSEAVSRSGLLGAAGALASITTDSALDSLLTSTPFLLRAVMLCVPLARADVVMVHAPEVPLAVALPFTVPSTSSSMVRFEMLAGPTPEKVGVVSLVLLSVLETPVSDAA